jgi:DNA-binding CsgD family transcriptional regulator
MPAERTGDGDWRRAAHPEAGADGRVDASPAAVAAVATLATARGLGRVIETMRDVFYMKHLSYLAARYGNDPAKDPYVRSTYPATWMARYLLKRYWRIDPVMREGFRRIAPFDWAEIDRTDPKVAAFFVDAERFEVGRNGLCIPLTNRLGQRGILSVASDLTGAAWSEYKAAFMPDFIEVGQAVHRRALKELFGDDAPGPHLSPREKEMLRWVAAGKEVPDIALITALSEHTVRTYLKSARLKLDCGTMAQAVVKAERLNLLNDPDQ